MRHTLRDEDIGYTYPKYPLHNLGISFEGLGMTKTQVYNFRDYFANPTKLGRYALSGTMT